MRQFFRSVIAATALAATAPLAAAEVEIRIDLSDLDLADPTQVEEIHERINLAVTRACRTNTLKQPTLSASAECKADGLAKAKDELSRLRVSLASAR